MTQTPVSARLRRLRAARLQRNRLLDTGMRASCPAGAPAPCIVTVRVQLPGSRKRGHRKAITETHRVRIKAGRTVQVRVRVSRRLIRAKTARARTLTVRVTST